MTREEAELVAGKLVTIDSGPEDTLYVIIRVAGVAVSTHLTKSPELWAKPWRDAIVRTLVGET